MALYQYNKRIEDIAKEYNIVFFVYFGSYKTAFYHNESDIDIAFLSEDNMTSEEKLNLVEELIKYHRKSEIDLVDLRKAQPLLRYEIGINGRVLYEKFEGVFDRYSLFYIKRFYELKPSIATEMSMIMQDVKEVISDAR